VAKGRSDAVPGNPVTAVRGWPATSTASVSGCTPGTSCCRARARGLSMLGPGHDLVADFDGLGSVHLSLE
jgi:2-keto-4-pentenoate hydratase